MAPEKRVAASQAAGNGTGLLTTVLVKGDVAAGEPEVMILNKEDFDPDVHKIYKAPKDPKPTT